MTKPKISIPGDDFVFDIVFDHPPVLRIPFDGTSEDTEDLVGRTGVMNFYGVQIRVKVVGYGIRSTKQSVTITTLYVEMLDRDPSASS